ncbi:MAG: LytTR family DNA-binding domain-containing protein [Bacteroidota bacterium]
MLKAVIIDDEKKSCTVLANLLEEFCKDVKVCASAPSVVEGVKAINSCNPDVVFLDIEMPRQNGFALFDYYDEIPFNVVFITAYDEYAIKAFRFSAIDYLLKPVDIEELQDAVQKVNKRVNTTELEGKLRVLKDIVSKPFQNLALPSAEGMVFVKVDNIVFCQADSNYTHVHLINNERITVSRTLGKFEELLEGLHFARIHHSYLINLNHISRYTKNKQPTITMVNDVNLNLSQTYKTDFLERVSRL